MNPEAKIQGIKVGALMVAAEHLNFEDAVLQEQEAKLCLVEAAVAAIKPALRALGSRLVQARSKLGCEVHGIAAGQILHAEIRGVEVIEGVALGEDGTWYVDQAPRNGAEFDGRCYVWDWQPTAPATIVQEVGIEQIVDGMARAIEEQASGRKAAKTYNAVQRALKLRALAAELGAK